MICVQFAGAKSTEIRSSAAGFGSFAAGTSVLACGCGAGAGWGEVCLTAGAATDAGAVVIASLAGGADTTGLRGGDDFFSGLSSTAGGVAG